MRSSSRDSFLVSQCYSTGCVELSFYSSRPVTFAFRTYAREQTSPNYQFIVRAYDAGKQSFDLYIPSDSIGVTLDPMEVKGAITLTSVVFISKSILILLLVRLFSLFKNTREFVSKGYLITYTPFGKLYHHESYSRKELWSDDKRAHAIAEIRTFAQKWSSILAQDPYYNPNLYLLTEEYHLSFAPRVMNPWE